MTCCGVARKAVLERLDWLFDFGCWLTPGDSIITAHAEADSGFVWETLPVIEGERVRLWISGGMADESYSITLRITTAQGRAKTECMTLRVVTPAKDSEWPNPNFVNNWADRIYQDCLLGY